MGNLRVAMNFKALITMAAVLTVSATSAFADEATALDLLNPSVGPTASSGAEWYEAYAFEESDKRDIAEITSSIETDEFELAWSGVGRWGLSLDLTRRSENPVLPEEEITAGAFYQLTPRFRFGGGISIGGKELSGAESWTDEENKTGIRIESAFSF